MVTRQIQVDRDVCIGAGMCALLADSVFSQDEDDGRVVVLVAEPDGDDEAVQDAVMNCPSGALTMTQTP